jgi:hypothetical protein
MRHLGAFFVVTVVATVILTLYLILLPVLLDANASLREVWPGFSFVLIFVAPFTVVGGLLAGLPVYVVGAPRGWFCTIWRSIVAGAITGTIYAGVIALFVTEWRPYPLLSLIFGGLISGAVAGALWFAMLGPASRAEAH